MQGHLRECPTCGQLFAAAGRWQVYCHTTCWEARSGGPLSAQPPISVPEPTSPAPHCEGYPARPQAERQDPPCLGGLSTVPPSPAAAMGAAWLDAELYARGGDTRTAHSAKLMGFPR